jgi:hypothetical protein
MKNLEIRTKNKNSVRFDYKGNLNEVITFLRHPEDKIKISQGDELTEIEIYQNGQILFSGDKYELFKQLKK